MAGTVALAGGGATAQDAPKATLSAEVAFASDYRFRGVSFSDGAPVVQAGIEVGLEPGWFAGLWGSAALVRSGGDREVDLYAGRSGHLRGFGYTISAYAYSDGQVGRMSYAELRTLVSHDVGPGSLEVELSAGTPQVRGGRKNVYFALTSRAPIGSSGVSVLARLGFENGFYRRKVDYEVGAEYARAHWTLSATITGCLRGSLAIDRLAPARVELRPRLLVSIARAL